MSQSQLSQFVARMKSDERITQQVLAAEREVAERTQRLKEEIDAVGEQNWESLRRIAAEHGYDIMPDKDRPQRMATPSDQELDRAICLLTCCWVVTSVWDGEGIPTIDCAPGCTGTTEFCPF